MCPCASGASFLVFCGLESSTEEGRVADAPLLDRRRNLSDGRTWWTFAPCSSRLPASNALAVRALPGRGLGCVALRAIAPGERILAEVPLVFWASRRGDKADDFAQLDALVEALDPEARESFFALADSFGGRGKTAAGIWNTSSFVTQDYFSSGGVNDGVHRAAVFRICSRFNHACHPNCFVAWSGALGQQTVHAIRPIDAGTELTIAYMAGAEAGARASRRALLEQKYFFTCACSTCMLEGIELERSDARHARLVEIHRQLEAEGCSARVVSLVEEQLRLMREEGVPLILGKAGWLLAVVQLPPGPRWAPPPPALRWAKIRARTRPLRACWLRASSALYCLSTLGSRILRYITCIEAARTKQVDFRPL